MAKNVDLNVVAIRFQPVGRAYHFEASDFPDLEEGDYVIVSTSRGRELGQVVSFKEQPEAPPGGQWKPVERRATARDLVMSRMWKQREVQALVKCREKAAEFGLDSIKIAKAEFSFDGARLTFLYTSDENGKGDLKKLQTSMKRSYRKSWVELRQIGPRDLAKIIAGMGACGMTERCCACFMTEFSPISIRMAKAQGVSLNPQEITGMCGRLRCCLMHEYSLYVEARKKLPKRKKRVITPLGEGRVVEVHPLTKSVTVSFENGKKAEFEKDDLKPYEEYKALQEKADQPCEKHGDSNCNCGKKND
jgi:cell fate regulator YaaT (PSP1 superfamily)